MGERRIIEIVSSPDGSPEPSSHMPRRGKAGKQRAQPIPLENVIELTDSDNEVRVRPSPVKRRNPSRAAKAAPEAGPSRIVSKPSEPKNVQLPLFLPDLDDAPVASSSKRAVPPPVPAPVEAPVPWYVAPPVEPAPEIAPLAEPDPAPFIPDPDPFVPAPAAEPGPLIAAEVDPLDGYVARVLEIIPDVRTSYARDLIEGMLQTFSDDVVEHVLHTLFENPAYPREEKKDKGKRKREDAEDAEDAEAEADARARANPKPRVDYASEDREHSGGAYYGVLALEQLYGDFPQIPVSHVRTTFVHHGRFYAPTHLFLREEAKRPALPYKRKTSCRSGKGKGIARTDAELDKERAWLVLRLRDAEAGAGPGPAEAEDAEDADGIECGCCFSHYSFDKMVQCPEAHLFCTDCMTSYASTLLGGHDANIVCMDQSGCKLAFPDSELRRFLSPKLLALYERVTQQKEIAAAGLEGLEECPFCEYKVVIDNDQERLFRCENEDCGAVSCRACKKLDHLPKSCKEVDADKKLDVRHAIEEAMTHALMRNCPRCQKAFVKEMGCNKMICPNCNTMSCYVCRNIISGYAHFNNPPPYTGKVEPNKCALWDSSVEGRHSDEVTAAAKRVIEEFKQAHPELSEEDLKVDLPPPAPAAGPSNAVPGAQVARGVPHVQMPQMHLAQAIPPGFAPQMQQQIAAVYNLHVNINGQPVLPAAPAVPAPARVPAPVAAPKARPRRRNPRRKA